MLLVVILTHCVKGFVRCVTRLKGKWSSSHFLSKKLMVQTALEGSYVLLSTTTPYHSTSTLFLFR